MAIDNAASRYQKRSVVRLTVGFCRNTEADLIAHLERQPNRSGYVKRLIRQDMERASVRA